jgi:hypothetical protein
MAKQSLLRTALSMVSCYRTECTGECLLLKFKTSTAFLKRCLRHEPPVQRLPEVKASRLSPSSLPLNCLRHRSFYSVFQLISFHRSSPIFRMSSPCANREACRCIPRADIVAIPWWQCLQRSIILLICTSHIDWTA